MSKQWIVFSAIALALATGPAAAQTPPPVPGGAFDQLSPGNQKIARAIFESQQFSPTPPTAPKPLSLDQIAGLKQSGRGWGVVYKDLQAKGLVTDKNLGQAVSRFNHEHKSTGPSNVEITTGSGKTVSAGRTGDAGSSRRSFSSDDDGHDSSSASARSSQGNAPGGSGDGTTGTRGGGASHGGGRGK